MDVGFKTVAEKTLQAVKGSNVFMALVNSNYFEDPVCALQLGMAVMQGKPIGFLVDEGNVLPTKLINLADYVGIVDFKDTEKFKEQSEKLVMEFVNKYKK